MTPPTSPHSPALIDIFISYSHKDDNLWAELDVIVQGKCIKSYIGIPVE